MGQVATIDEQDIGLLAEHTWRYDKDGYLVATTDRPYRGAMVYFHRLVAGAKHGQIVDHVNRNKLDNRRCNLRLVTPSQNVLNQGKKRSRSGVQQSQFRGVFWNTERGKWEARHMRKFLGRFDSEVEAAEAYNKAAAGNPFVPKNKPESRDVGHQENPQGG